MGKKKKLSKEDKWDALVGLKKKGFIDWDGDLEDKNSTVAITEKGYKMLDEEGMIDDDGYFVK